MNNHVQQHQPPSSSDEQDVSPVRTENEKVSPPIIIQKQTRTNSMESKPPSHSQMAKSYDSNQVYISIHCHDWMSIDLLRD